jgi:hypothetical protein
MSNFRLVSDGFVSPTTSELNKKFKVIVGDLFKYTLPRMDNATEFELISGPYGATLMPTNGTLSWQAISNLIADSWSELFIIKAKGVCEDDFTLIEITVHVVSCQCLNSGTCLLIQDVPSCRCKSGFKGRNCEIMEDPCMVPRCNFGQCIPDGINFSCKCHPGYTGSLCTVQLEQPCINEEECSRSLKPCDQKPCHIGVECFPIGQDDYVCGHCPPDMTGNGKKCYKSSSDFFAQLCSTDETNPCFDKSMCKEDGHGSVFCKACPRGFKGDGVTCQPVGDAQDPCDKTSTNPCYPGSKCQVVNGIVTCGPCPTNMTGDGKNCQKLKPCQGRMECDGTCPPGSKWDGQSCQDEYLCDPNPCFPGVQCEVQLESEAVCGSCPKGMHGDGRQCSRQVPDHCQTNPCFPGTDCYNFHDKFKCGTCPEGFTGNGLKCTPANDPCDHNPCHPGVPCMTVWKGRQALFACGLCPDGKYSVKAKETKKCLLKLQHKI